MLISAGADVSRLPLPCGELSGLVGFGVALTPFSKGGKRDHANFMLLSFYTCTIPNPPGPALPRLQGRVRELVTPLLFQGYWQFTYFYIFSLVAVSSLRFCIVPCFRCIYLSEYPTSQKIKYQENFL